MWLRHLVSLALLAAGLNSFAQGLPAGNKATANRAAALPVASLAQQEAAKLVHLGESHCDQDHPLVVKPHASHDGYIDVAYRKLRFVMRPVLSSTGAVRLEDVQGRALLLQIAFKSMLMDTRAGQRLADNCVHETQAAAERAFQENPGSMPRLLTGTPAGSGPAVNSVAAPVPAVAASQAPV